MDDKAKALAEKREAEEREAREAKTRNKTIIAGKQAILRNLKQDLTRKRGELKLIETELARAAERSAALTRDLRNYPSVSSSKDSQTTSELKTINQKLIQERGSLATLEKEEKDLTIAARAAERGETEEKSAANQTQREVEELKVEEQKLEEEKQTLDNQIRNLGTELKADGQSKLNQPNQAEREIIKEINKHQAEIEAEKRQLDKLERELKELEGKLTQVKTTNTSNKQLKTKTDFELKQKQSRLLQVTSQIKSIMGKIGRFKVPNNQVTGRKTAKALEQDLARKEALIQEKKRLINQLDAKVKNLTREAQNASLSANQNRQATKNKERELAAHAGLTHVRAIDKTRLSLAIKDLEMKERQLQDEINTLERTKNV